MVTTLKTGLIICMVFIACGANVVFLELLIKYSPGCGDLVTFSQFLLTAIYGFVAEFKLGTKKSNVPIHQYMIAVLLYYGSSITGNLAFSYNISMPVQMIFKSGSVMASMALGVVLLNKKYTFSKYVSVAMITIGISACLLASASDKDNNEEGSNTNSWNFVIGVGLLLTSLLTGARLGIAQEQIVKSYGKHPREMMFYIHVLSLPFFGFFANNIYKQATTFTQSDAVVVDGLPFDIPIVWVYLGMNMFTQFICVNCVTYLMTELSALSITVILTLRKFVSLTFSILYFKNPFTVYHFCGSMLVFGGTLLFSEVPQKIRDTLTSAAVSSSKDRKKTK